MARAAGIRERTVLVVADDAADAKAAVHSVIRAAADDPLDLHLVNVQPRLGANAARYLDRGVIRRFQLEEGHARIDGLRRGLRAAGVRCVGHVAVGDAPACIRSLAREIGADEIVIAARPARFFGKLLFDLWAGRIARASRVPVTILPAAPGRRPLRPGTAWGVVWQR